MFPEEVATDRLHLERLTQEHLFELYEHARRGAPGIEGITEYVSWSPHRSLGETREFVDRSVEQWNDGEGVTYVLRPTEDETNEGEFGGTTGFGIDWDRRTATLGLWLRKPLWGREYSGERAGALMDLAFSALDLDLVAVSHHPENENSERAIEKYVERYGGRREGLLRNGLLYQDGTVVDEVRYSISQAEYREAIAESS
jgi:RimJ/RimL family protein N-acetyltransferase